MFCEMAPFSLSMESISFTGSSKLRPEGLFSCRAILVGEMSGLFWGTASCGVVEFVTVSFVLSFFTVGLLSCATSSISASL